MFIWTFTWYLPTILVLPYTFLFKVLGLRVCSSVAVEGEDYNLITPVITFPDMSVVGATACATFTIIDDRVLEPNNEFFRVQLTSPDPPGLTIFIPSSAAVVRIKDNEGRSS